MPFIRPYGPKAYKFVTTPVADDKFITILEWVGA